MNEEAQQRNPLMSMLNEEPQPPNPLMSMLSEESAAPRGSPLPTLITESASAVDVSSGGEDESDDEESVTFVTDFRTMYSDLKKKVKILIQVSGRHMALLETRELIECATFPHLHRCP